MQEEPFKYPGDELNPPSAARVAQRLMVLISLVCRSSLEDSPKSKVCHRTHSEMLEWLPAMGLADEFEPSEWNLLNTKLGELTRRDHVNASWKTEGAVALAWALNRFELPSYDEQAIGIDIGDAIGFLNEDVAIEFLSAPALRTKEELHWYADLTCMVHWRLREYERAQQKIDFIEFARLCDWASMPIDDIEVIARDLACRGKPVWQLSRDEFEECRSIAMERQRAANWLIGTEELYSDVTCDT